MKPQDQSEFPPDLVELVNESWKGARCFCYSDTAVCVTCSSVAVLRALRLARRLVRDA